MSTNTAAERWQGDFSSTDTAGIVFDFIIVGSGSAGAVLANRLSEDGTKDVLLIEAGGLDINDAIHMPAACGTCQRGEIDWQYQTVPQKNSHIACENQRSNWPRGKVLGGCSSINYMLFVRGDPHDFDQWNLSDWSFDIMLKYFRRLERADPERIPRNDKYRNHEPNDGFVNASMLEQTNPLNELFIEASVKNGFHRVEDYNAQESLNGCVAMSQMSTKDGKRWSTASAYLLDAVKRKNCHLLVNAHVCRVTFDGERRAMGVVVRRERSSEKEELIRGKEVILSAGAVASPQLLLLSGIGPRAQLEALHIPVIVDLPGVGKNLQDHIFTPLFYLTSIPTLSSKDLNEANLGQWATQGRGVLTSSGVESHSWCQVKPSDGTLPDIQTQFGTLTMDENLFQNLNYSRDLYKNHFQKHLVDEGWYTVVCLLTLLHPKSRGEIKLASSNPFDHPLIDPSYLSERDDVDRLIRACRLFEKICGSERLKDLLRPMIDQLNEDCRREGSEEIFWESFVRKYSLTVYHPVGTCRMGASDDPMTVVSPSTHVQGVRHLRVIDASIMPFLPSGNTNIPTVALAERAADLIRKDF